MKDDPLAVGQRWYCNACGCKYKTTMGVLIEFYKDGMATYCLAEFPPQSICDARGLMIESAFKDIKTPEELLAAVPNSKPLSDAVLKRESEGIYKIAEHAQLEALDTFKWEQLFNLPETKKQKKKRQAEEWSAVDLSASSAAAPEPLAQLEELSC
jgi:hypothetical protein